MRRITWHESNGLKPYKIDNFIHDFQIMNKWIVFLYKDIAHDLCFCLYDIDFNNICIQIKKYHKNNYYIMFMDDWIKLKEYIYNEIKEDSSEKFFNYCKKHNIKELTNSFGFWYSKINNDGTIEVDHPELFKLLKNQKLLYETN